MVVAAIVLEGTACVQYFTSQAAIKREVVQRAECELRKAELEIEKKTIEQESALKMLVSLAERYIDCPDSLAAMSHLMLETMGATTNVGIAFVENYYPEKGKWFEIYTEWDNSKGSSNPKGLTLTTREIGGPQHDYLQMEWYLNGLEHDSCWWSEPYFDNSGARSMVVTCSHPIHNKKGEVVAVAGIDLSLDYLESVSEYLRVFPNSYYSIRSSKGLSIVDAVDTIPGHKYYNFSEEIDATGWQMEIIIPDRVLFAELRRAGLIITLMMITGLIVLAFMLLHSRKMTKELLESTEKNQRMEDELHIAKTIQMAMLPKVFPPFTDCPDLNIYGMVDPAKEVGGDLYDFYVRHDKLFFCIGDVSGKGVPASLVMAMTRSLFRNSTANEERPEMIVGEMNRALVEQNMANMFVTLFLGVLDCKTGLLNYCNAGHNAPVVESESLPILPNLPLGIESDYEYKAQTTHIHFGDVLFLYTDGLTEAENRLHEQFGEERMIQELKTAKRKLKGERPRELVEQMLASVDAFVDGAEQSDDLTMLAIRYQRPALEMRNDIEQIPTLSEWIEELGLPVELNMPINLALEETVTNVMLYAYPGKSGHVFVEFVENYAGEDRELVFTIMDCGIPFDPTKQAEADTTLSVEERPIGGLGIFLVRQLMDEVSYRREDDQNVLTLVKKLKRENASKNE